MVEITIQDYKKLSWDRTKARGLEVLKAREYVEDLTEKEWWGENVVSPGYTPTLLEQLNYTGLSCLALCVKMRQEREASAKHRKGVKVLDMDDLRKTKEVTP